LAGVYFVKLIKHILNIPISNNTKLDLNLLTVFDALMMERSVTRVGLRLHLSQPTVSNALLRLRASLSDPLFVRTRAGMEPTAKAMEIHVDIARGLRLIERGLEKERLFNPLASSREFRILLSDVGEVLYLPKLMREIAITAPNLTISAFQLPYARYSEALRTGEVDLAISTAVQLSGDGFYQQRLFEDRHICLVREGHPRIKKNLTMAQFLRESHVNIHPIWNPSGTFEVILRDLKIERRIALRVGHYLSVTPIIRESDYLACLPSKVVTAMQPMQGVRALPLPFRTPPLSLKQLWHRRSHHDPAARWFRSMIIESIGESASQR